MKIEMENNDYIKLLRDLKKKIINSQQRAVLSVNKELILLYWEIGRNILENQEQKGWGSKIIDNLSRDLKIAFPEMKGFSARNLKYMRKFARNYPDRQFVQQAVAQITWSHNLIIMEKIKEPDIRKWYIQKNIENGWSRAVLIHQIELDLFNRSAKAITNFDKTLPAPQSDLANETLKDPYIFDFLNLKEKADERDIENQLVKHITSFLLELGAGFAFVGQQYKIAVDDTDFYIDLLFYHLKLKAYIVIELKVVEFKPEFAGKLNFYLSAVDDLVKSQDDNPSIGLILCKTKNKIQAEYALKDINKPLGIAEYRIGDAIPSELKSSLPSIEEIETELGGLIDNG